MSRVFLFRRMALILVLVSLALSPLSVWAQGPVAPPTDNLSETYPTAAEEPAAIAGDPVWGSRGPAGVNIEALAIHPTEPRTVLAVGDGGIYISRDAGASWSTLVNRSGLTSLAISPAAPHTIYAGGWEGVLMSSDGGSTWSLSTTGLPYGPSVTALLVEPARPATVYASLREYRVYKSSDGGASWSPASSGLPAGLVIYALAGHPTIAGRIYAATGAGVYFTSDGGGSWSRAGGGLPIISFRDVALDPAQPARLFVIGMLNPYHAGFYRSEDGGATWSLARSGLVGADGRGVVVTSGAVYALTNQGVFRSTDAGRRWRGLYAGRPTGMHLRALAIAPGYPDVVYAGAQSDSSALRGVWSATLTTLPPLSLPPTDPPKAVLIVGPIDPPDNAQTQRAIDLMEPRGALLESYGLQVVRLFHPQATWTNIRQHLQGASLVLYHGHGFGYGPDDPNYVDSGGGNNGFCISDPANPAGSLLATQDILIAYTQLARNAVVMTFACFSAGSSACDASVVSEDVARRRVNDYAYTFLTAGAGAYFAGGDWVYYLRALIETPAKRAGDIFLDWPPLAASTVRKHPHIQNPDAALWLAPSVDSAGRVLGWWTAFVGHTGLTGAGWLGSDIPRLDVSPGIVTLDVPAGEAFEQIVELNITNEGAGQLNWHAQAGGADWLSVLIPSGGAPGTLLLQVNSAGLPPGVHRGSVTVHGVGLVEGSPRVVPVTLHAGGSVRIYLPLLSRR